MNKTPGELIYQAINADDLEEIRRVCTAHPVELHCNPGVADSWLHYAVNKNKSAIADLFIELGIDVNFRQRLSDGSISETTPITGAAAKGHYEMVRHLLKRGANPNYGQVLISAMLPKAEPYSFDLVKLLVDHGVDVNMCWRFGDPVKGPIFNALSWAVDGGREDIAGYLRSHGAIMPTENSLVNEKTAIEAFVDFFEKTFDTPKPLVLTEIVAATDPTTMVYRATSKDRNAKILFAPVLKRTESKNTNGVRDPILAGLFIELPINWPLDVKDLADPNIRWPIEWLRKLATYLGHSEEDLNKSISIVANGEPPEPLAPGARLAGLMLVANYGGIGPAQLGPDNSITVFTILPLYKEEIDLERTHGLPELFRRLDQFGITTRFDPERTNVACS